MYVLLECNLKKSVCCPNLMNGFHKLVYFPSQGSDSERQGGNGGSAEKKSRYSTFVSHYTGSVSKKRSAFNNLLPIAEQKTT